MSDFTFLNVLDDSLDYNMNHRNAGRCLVFDHEHFDDPEMKPRYGTKEDVRRIESFFYKRLGFEVIAFHDLTKSQLIEETQKMANEDFRNYNCFVCCILTHGTETHLHARDGIYKLEQIISFFRAERCQSLAGKPKLFFIQACQGEQTDPGHELRILSVADRNHNTNHSSNSLATDVADGQNTTHIVTARIPICADIMVAYSTVPKHYSYRDIITGSWFFEVLMEVFEQHFEEHDLITILTITKRRIAFEKISDADNPSYHNKKQIPWITDTLTRRVFFKKLVPINEKS